MSSRAGRRVGIGRQELSKPGVVVFSDNSRRNRRVGVKAQVQAMSWDNVNKMGINLVRKEWN